MTNGYPTLEGQGYPALRRTSGWPKATQVCVPVAGEWTASPQPAGDTLPSKSSCNQDGLVSPWSSPRGRFKFSRRSCSPAHSLVLSSPGELQRGSGLGGENRPSLLLASLPTAKPTVRRHQDFTGTSHKEVPQRGGRSAKSARCLGADHTQLLQIRHPD